ncbi:MAG TPA: hypothetical protein EYO22_00055 [Candidatus Poseidoniales archaeon]|nr:hypothetical protein [Candidatus Poseidoniales archaeon]
MADEDWLVQFNLALDAWDKKYIITSPDIDGILSACLLSNKYGAKLSGIYTTRYLILFDNATSSDAKRALWLDHDISEQGIQCMGQHLVDHSEMVEELIQLGVAKRGSRSGTSSLIPEGWQKLQGKQSISYRKNSDPQEWLAKFNGITQYVSSATNWKLQLPQCVSSMYRGLVLELSNRGEIKDGEFDQFMYDEEIFSHAITGAGTMRFTKRLSISDEIQSYEEISIPRNLF